MEARELIATVRRLWPTRNDVRAGIEKNIMGEFAMQLADALELELALGLAERMGAKYLKLHDACIERFRKDEDGYEGRKAHRCILCDAEDWADFDLSHEKTCPLALPLEDTK